MPLLALRLTWKVESRASSMTNLVNSRATSARTSLTCSTRCATCAVARGRTCVWYSKTLPRSHQRTAQPPAQVSKANETADMEHEKLQAELKRLANVMHEFQTHVSPYLGS